ncbi:MAG: hypothetical protein ABSH25_03045 [Syntrophorhabdales bacterium]
MNTTRDLWKVCSSIQSRAFAERRVVMLSRRLRTQAGFGETGSHAGEVVPLAVLSSLGTGKHLAS